MIRNLGNLVVGEPVSWAHILCSTVITEICLEEDDEVADYEKESSIPHKEGLQNEEDGGFLRIVWSSRSDANHDQTVSLSISRIQTCGIRIYCPLICCQRIAACFFREVCRDSAATCVGS